MTVNICSARQEFTEFFIKLKSKIISISQRKSKTELIVMNSINTRKYNFRKEFQILIAGTVTRGYSIERMEKIIIQAAEVGCRKILLQSQNHKFRKIWEIYGTDQMH